VIGISVASIVGGAATIVTLVRLLRRARAARRPDAHERVYEDEEREEQHETRRSILLQLSQWQSGVCPPPRANAGR
jgi:hypothetical protein